MLAIDDSPAILSLIVDTLTHHNHSVETANNGEEALAKYVQFKPDLVTIDLAMPGLDGYETLIRLKRIDPYVNIIMLTAADHSDALKRCLQAGALDFVSKPFNTTELANTVMRAVQDRKYRDRNVSAFFALLNSKLTGAIGKAFAPRDLSLELKDVQTIKNIDPKASEQGSGEWATICFAEDDVCFITQAAGDRQCMVSSYVSATALSPLFDMTSIKERQMSDKALEFFNMVNMKVVSELANTTQKQLDCKPALFFSKPHIMTRFWSETARMWSRIAQGTFEINWHGRTISFGVRIWYEGELFA